MKKAYALIAIGAGALLVSSGIKGRSAWADVVATLRNEPLPTNKPNVVAQTYNNITSGLANFAKDAAKSAAKLTPGNPSDLVTLTDIYGKPTNAKLTPDAAAAFQRAQERLGRTIPITSGWRDYNAEVQRNKQDPVRFPVPNYHTIGKAIDVWAASGLPGWLGAPSNDPALVAALEAEGWQRFDPTNKRGEAMHWSYGGRG